jgi:fatty acid desaturase
MQNGPTESQPAPAISDRQLVTRAYRLTADLARPNAAVYWTDLLASAAVGWTAFAMALRLGMTAGGIAAALVSALALYRGISFIHEIVHLRQQAPHWFWTAWHILIGVPMLVPSFMYEGVHNLHHSKVHYGTAGDPEYLPLASYRPRATALILLWAAVEPLFLVLRFLLMTPAAALIPSLRPIVVERMSAMVMNPAFCRRTPPQPRTAWIAIEIATSAYAWTFVLATVSGVLPVAVGTLYLALWCGISTTNMVRTLAAHHYASDGHADDVIGQVLDTASVPPPALLPVLWAPVGLRYHALHHLLPNLPYHNLGAAHRRLTASLPAGSLYRRTVHRRAGAILGRLLRAQARADRAARCTASEPTTH